METLPKLTEALVKFQREMSPIKREAKNPGFKRADGRPSTYADFASTVEAIREPMAECGLAFIQLLGGDPSGITVTTILTHVSGESVRGTAWSPIAQQTPQAVGSATSYLKRYSLWAILGLATEDDDGQAASQKKPTPAKPAPPKDHSKLVEAFKALNIPLAHLEDRVRAPIAMWSETDVADLRKFYAEARKAPAHAAANVDAEQIAKRLEAEKAEAGIAAEQAKKAAEAGPAKPEVLDANQVFAGYIDRIRAATTPGAVALVVAEAAGAKLTNGSLTALQRTANDRILVLKDAVAHPPGRRPQIEDKSADVPL